MIVITLPIVYHITITFWHLNDTILISFTFSLHDEFLIVALLECEINPNQILIESFVTHV